MTWVICADSFVILAIRFCPSTPAVTGGRNLQFAVALFCTIDKVLVTDRAMLMCLNAIYSAGCRLFGNIGQDVILQPIDLKGLRPLRTADTALVIYCLCRTGSLGLQIVCRHNFLIINVCCYICPITMTGNRTCMPVMGFVITPLFTEIMDIFRNCNRCVRTGYFNGALVLINCSSATRCTFRQIITRNQIDSNICRSRSAYLPGGSLYSILNIIVVFDFFGVRIYDTCHSSSGDRFNLLNMADRAGIGLVPFLIDSRVNGIRQRPLMRTSTLRGNLSLHNRTTDRAIAAFAQVVVTAGHRRNRHQCMLVGGIRVEHAQHLRTVRHTVCIVRCTVQAGRIHVIGSAGGIKRLRISTVLTKRITQITGKSVPVCFLNLGHITGHIHIVSIGILHAIGAECALCQHSTAFKIHFHISLNWVEVNGICIQCYIVFNRISLDIGEACKGKPTDCNAAVNGSGSDLLAVFSKPRCLIVLQRIVRLMDVPGIQPVVCIIVRNHKTVPRTGILAEFQRVTALAIIADDPPHAGEGAVLLIRAIGVIQRIVVLFNATAAAVFMIPAAGPDLAAGHTVGIRNDLRFKQCRNLVDCTFCCKQCCSHFALAGRRINGSNSFCLCRLNLRLICLGIAVIVHIAVQLVGRRLLQFLQRSLRTGIHVCLKNLAQRRFGRIGVTIMTVHFHHQLAVNTGGIFRRTVHRCLISDADGILCHRNAVNIVQCIYHSIALKRCFQRILREALRQGNICNDLLHLLILCIERVRCMIAVGHSAAGTISVHAGFLDDSPVVCCHFAEPVAVTVFVFRLGLQRRKEIETLRRDDLLTIVLQQVVHKCRRHQLAAQLQAHMRRIAFQHRIRLHIVHSTISEYVFAVALFIVQQDVTGVVHRAEVAGACILQNRGSRDNVIRLIFLKRRNGVHSGNAVRVGNIQITAVRSLLRPVRKPCDLRTGCFPVQPLHHFLHSRGITSAAGICSVGVDCGFMEVLDHNQIPSLFKGFLILAIGIGICTFCVRRLIMAASVIGYTFCLPVIQHSAALGR